MSGDQSKKLRVFLSWSGERSKAAAQALRDWLPSVLQNVKPYFTPDDIEKGARWSGEIRTQLEASDFGIICLTPENVSAPWILFEAGALSKLEKSRVAPLLLDLEPAEVTGPLGQLQLTRMTKEEMLKLIRVLNNVLAESGLEESVLSKVFERWWDDLERSLKTAAESRSSGPQPKKRPDRDMLEEVLVRVRSVQQHLEMRDPVRRHFISPRRLELMPKVTPETSVVELPIAPRSVESLINHGIEKVGDILRLTEIEILKIPNMGKRGQIELVELLEELGYKIPPA